MPFVGHAVGYEHVHRRLDPNRYLTPPQGSRKKWKVQIWFRGQRFYLGYWPLLEARMKRDEWLAKHKRQVRFCRRVERDANGEVVG